MNKFVTFEGCDGVGKTAQLKKLKIYCDAFKPTSFLRESRAGAQWLKKSGESYWTRATRA